MTNPDFNLSNRMDISNLGYVSLPPQSQKEYTIEQKEDIFQVVAKTGKETYVFKLTRPYKDEMLSVLGRMAANNDLDFSWYDNARCSVLIQQKIPTQKN